MIAGPVEASMRRLGIPALVALLVGPSLPALPAAAEAPAASSLAQAAARARAGDVDGALALAEPWLRGASAPPADDAAVRELGIRLAGAGRYPPAYRLLKTWAEAHPEDTPARWMAALCAVQLERPGEASALLAGADAARPEVQLLRARVRRLEGDPWGAIAILEPLQAAAPVVMAADVRHQLADAYVAVGESAKAVDLLAGRGGGDPAVALLLARAQHHSGDAEAALSTLEPVARSLRGAADAGQALPPLAAEILVETGRLQLAARRPAEALPDLERAARLQPADKQAWLQLGQAFAMLGRPADAEVALHRFQDIQRGEGSVSASELRLQQDREDPTARELRRALELVSQGRFAEALAVAEQEAAFAPDDPRPLVVVSRALLFAGRLADSLEVAEQLVARWPDDAHAVFQRGLVRRSLRDLAGAEGDFRRVLELSPEHVAAMNALAALLVDRGDEVEARALLERALSLQPEDPDAAAALARLAEP